MDKQASTVVPRVVEQGRRSTDDIVREAEGVVARIKNRIPGLSESLPPKYDTLTGKPIDQRAEWYSIFFNPTRREQPPAEVPAYLADMYELGMKAPDVPRRMATFKGQTLDRSV